MFSEKKYMIRKTISKIKDSLIFIFSDSKIEYFPKYISETTIKKCMGIHFQKNMRGKWFWWDVGSRSFFMKFSPFKK